MSIVCSTSNLNNIDKSTPTNYQLIFPKIPTETTIAANNPFVMNIHSAIVPPVSIAVEELRWHGTKSKRALSPMEFDPWLVSFVVDVNLANWNLLRKWMQFINNNNDKIAEYHSEYSVDAAMVITDNYGNMVKEIIFVDIWPMQIGEISFSQREGDMLLESTVNFNYDYFYIRDTEWTAEFSSSSQSSSSRSWISSSSSSLSSSSSSSSSSMSSSSSSLSSSSSSISSSSKSSSSESSSTFLDLFRFDSTYTTASNYDFFDQDREIHHNNTSNNDIMRTVGYTTTGKWYIELEWIEASSTSFHWPGFGLMDGNHRDNGFIGQDGSAVGVGTINYFNRLYHDGTYFTYNHNWAAPDVMMIAWDMGTGDIWFGKNGTWDTGLPGVSGSPSYTETEFIGSSAFFAINTDIKQKCKIRSRTYQLEYTPPEGFLPPSDGYSSSSSSISLSSSSLSSSSNSSSSSLSSSSNSSSSSLSSSSSSSSSSLSSSSSSSCFITASDDFSGADGDDLNPNRWTAITTDYSPTAYDVKISASAARFTLTGSNNAGGDNAYIDSKFKISGDFDIQCDYKNLVTNNNFAAGMAIEIHFDNGYFVFIKPQYQGGNNYLRRFSTGSPDDDTYGRTNDYGRLRITRSGSTVSVYYDNANSGSWSSAGSKTMTTDDCFVRFLMYDYNAGDNNRCDIDNFIVNSGTVICPSVSSSSSSSSSSLSSSSSSSSLSSSSSSSSSSLSSSSSSSTTPPLYYTIDSNNIDENLIDFPVGIILPSDFTSANSYENLHVTSGGTELFTEVESWETSGTIWTKVPFIPSGHDINLKLEYGSNNSYIGSTGTSAAQNVWNSGFEMVYHMNQDPTDASKVVLDSTSHERHCTTYGSMTSGDLVDGVFGKAIDFDGSNDYMGTDTDVNVLDLQGDEKHSFEAFVLGERDNDRGVIIGNYRNSSVGAINFEFTDSQQFRVYLREGSSDVKDYTADIILEDDEFYYLAHTYDGSGASEILKLFVSGIEDTVTKNNDDTLGSGSLQNDYSLKIGKDNRDNPSSIWFNGQIGEVRISSITRSAAWLKATNAVLKNILLTEGSSSSQSSSSSSSTTPPLYYTIDSSKIDATLTNFPVRIVLPSTIVSATETTDWKYLHITVDDVECYTEVEEWNPTNDLGILHARIPSASSSEDTTIKVVFGEENNYERVITSPEVFDDFTGEDGSSPDSAKWTKTVSVGSDYLSIQNNKLEYNSLGDDANHKTQIDSNFILSGAFDIQIDFDIISLTTPDDGFHHLPIFRLLDAGSQIGLINMQKSSDGDQEYRVYGTDRTETSLWTAHTTGKLRLTRNSSGLITAYYWGVTDEWVWGSGNTDGISLVTSNSNDLTVQLFFEQENNGVVDVTLDNFTINSCDGITGYIGETGEIAAQGVWDEDYEAVWHLVEDATDSTVNAHDGTLHGTPVFSREDGYAHIHFDGVNDYISEDFSISGDFTLDFLYNRQELPPTFVASICRNASGNSYQGIAFHANVKIYVDLDSGGSSTNYEDADIVVGEWTHFIVKRTSSTLTIYNNGEVLLESSTDTDSVLFQVYGYRPVYGDKHEWLMSEFRLSLAGRSDAYAKAVSHNIMGDLLTL